MAKSKVRKARPKAPENAPSVIAIRKTIGEWKEKRAKAKEAAKKDGKVDKTNPKLRVATKHLKRAQRKLYDEAVRLTPKKAPPATTEEKK
jgi:erythromycin esterase-like protein